MVGFSPGGVRVKVGLVTSRHITSRHVTFSFACSSVRPTIAISGCVKHAAGMARWSTSLSLPMMFSTALTPPERTDNHGSGLGSG